MHYKSREEAEVKDPFEDVLDLSESMLRRMKKFRIVLLFGLLGGLLLGVTLLLAGVIRIWYSLNDVGLTVLMILGGIASLVVFLVSSQLDGFLLHFERRMDTLLKAKDFNPNPRIPDRPTPIERIIHYLGKSDRELAEVFQSHPHNLVISEVFSIKNQVVKFDAYFFRRRYRYPSTQIFVRTLPEKVQIGHLQRFKKDVELVAQKRRLPPTRAIIVQTGGEILSEQVSDWAEKNWIVFPLDAKPGKEWHACPVEVFLETPTGFYDLAVFYMG